MNKDTIMKILLINHYAGSLEHGMEYRPFYFAREWVKMGHDVNIIAADYSHLRYKNPKIKEDFSRELIGGINYHWIKTIRYQGNGLKRALTMFQFVIKLYLYSEKISREFKPDVVISSSTYPLDTFASQNIAKLSNAKLIHEIHDMWPSTLVEIGGMSIYNPFVILMQISENSFCKHSDKVVSLLPYTKNYLIKHGMKEDSFAYIPNGVVVDDWNATVCIPENHSFTLKQLKDNRKFIVGYFGGHALSNALEVLLEVARTINIPEIHFVLVGDGVEKRSLQNIALNNKLNNITFLPPVSKLAIPNLLTYFDSIYIGGKRSSLYRFGVSLNKLYDSMMSGKPIIYALDLPNYDITDYQCGIAVKPQNINEIIDGIVSIYKTDEIERKNMGEIGKKVVLMNYDYSVLAKKFENVLIE